jgi:hypothetical protein
MVVRRCPRSISAGSTRKHSSSHHACQNEYLQLGNFCLAMNPEVVFDIPQQIKLCSPKCLHDCYPGLLCASVEKSANTSSTNSRQYPVGRCTAENRENGSECAIPELPLDPQNTCVNCNQILEGNEGSCPYPCSEKVSASSPTVSQVAPLGQNEETQHP